jgi:CDP-4-dehydro-6-deoxyglucose reductase
MTGSSSSIWRPARVLENRPVANGSMWIKLEATDKLPAAFEPGHVLGLGVPVDQGHMRHAYTISRADPESRQFEHLYRVIPGGRMTPRLAALPAGSVMYFHGPFHTPIQKEIRTAARRIVLVATGTGIGPVFGYAEKALNEGESRPMTLYAGFHVESDMCLVAELQELARKYQNFAWHFIVSHPSELWRGLVGRVTDWVPEQIDTNNLDSYHFHLVGNGEMVHVMRKALHHAGVFPERVSIETYFNHYAQPPESEIDQLAARFRSDGERG